MMDKQSSASHDKSTKRMNQNISCYCGASRGEVLRNRIRGGKHQPIARCEQCGVVQKAGVDEKEHVDFHREGGQAEEIDLDSMSESYVERNLTDVRRRVADLRSDLDGDETLLDFGTGMGHFLEAVHPYVDQAVGSEINRKRLSFVREELGFDVYEGTDALMRAFGKGAFDIVTMYHTLEHLPNPVEQLQQVRGLLDDEGLLVVEVPNHDDWLLSRSGAYADFYYQNAHTYYFEPGTLRDVLCRAGFEVEIKGVQRYSYRNALHWLLKGQPELNSPSRLKNTQTEPINKLYEIMLGTIGRTDTLYLIGMPKSI